MERYGTKPIQNFIFQCDVKTATGVYSCLSLDMQFQRQLSYYVVTIYVPTFMIVCVSWMSFWLDHKSAPARVSLTSKQKPIRGDFLVTQFALPPPPEPVSYFIINILNKIWRPNEQKFYEGSGLVTPSRGGEADTSIFAVFSFS